MLHADVGVYLRNSTRITQNERHVYKHESMFGAKVKVLNLKIVNVTKNDEGLYTCMGFRNGKKATATFHLETGLTV